MSLITNKVIGQAVRAEFPNRTIILSQLGVTTTDDRLNGKGAGDTIQFSNFNAITEGLQEITVKGTPVTYEELGQDSSEVTVREVARGVKFHQRDIQHSLSGGSIESEATRQLNEVFARGLDTEAMNTLLSTSISPVDGTTGLNGKIFLDSLFANYGENALEAARAIVVHPLVATQLMNAADGEMVRSDKYNPTFRGEIGKLYNSVPVIASERVQKDAVDNTYKNIIVPHNSLLYVLGRSMEVYNDFDIDTKWHFYNANLYFAMTLNGKHKPVVVKGAV
jgi:hypothetical protein